MPFGYEIRKELYPQEALYFKANPTVAGMAAKDGRIVLNPYSGLAPQQYEAVAKNEAIRLFMRENNVLPRFKITDEQKAYFKGTPYEGRPLDMRRTIIGRIISHDKSITPTAEQEKEAQKIFSRLAGH